MTHFLTSTNLGYDFLPWWFAKNNFSQQVSFVRTKIWTLKCYWINTFPLIHKKHKNKILMFLYRNEIGTLSIEKKGQKCGSSSFNYRSDAFRTKAKWKIGKNCVMLWRDVRVKKQFRKVWLRYLASGSWRESSLRWS